MYLLLSALCVKSVTVMLKFIYMITFAGTSNNCGMESGTTSDDRRSNDGVTASDQVVASKRTLTVSSIVIAKK